MIDWSVAAEMDEAMQKIKHGLESMGITESDVVGTYYERLRRELTELMSHVNY